MPIEYTEEKRFTREDAESLFLSVDWLSGRYPDRLYKALKGSSTVITAWDANQLVGLARVLDDGEMLAFMHYVLVRPSHQGMGIARTMIEMVKEKYRSYLYIDLMPEDKNNVPFYEKLGFVRMPEAAALQIVHL